MPKNTKHVLNKDGKWVEKNDNKKEIVAAIVLIILIAAAITVYLVFFTNKNSAPDNNDRFSATGVWALTGEDDQFLWYAHLVITQNRNGEFSGYFDWHIGDFYEGREHFRGSLDHETGIVTIIGVEHDDNTSGVLSKYNAELAENGYDFINGTWPDDGTWQAEYVNTDILD
jgi:hypothetical protein